MNTEEAAFGGPLNKYSRAQQLQALYKAENSRHVGHLPGAEPKRQLDRPRNDAAFLHFPALCPSLATTATVNHVFFRLFVVLELFVDRPFFSSPSYTLRAAAI